MEIVYKLYDKHIIVMNEFNELRVGIGPAIYKIRKVDYETILVP